MAPRNQNRPPCSPSNKKDAVNGVPLDKRRRIGAGRVTGEATVGRQRHAFAVLNNRQDVNAPVGVGNSEGSECGPIEFMKEEVDALLNEKLKANKFDNKKKMDQMGERIKRLKLCVKWFQQVEETHIQETGKLQSAQESTEKKCTEIEAEMWNKNEELKEIISDLRKTICSLEERAAKEESDKLDVINCHTREREAGPAAEKMQVSLSAKLEKFQQEKLAAEQKAASNEDLFKRSQEYNMSLQQYNSKLQTDLEGTSESLKQVETEKSTIVENLSKTRGHNKALQDQMSSTRASRDEVIKQNESLVQELKCLQGELQQVRDDRDHQVTQVEALTAGVAAYNEWRGKSCAELDNLSIKSNAQEETCQSQREQIRTLQQQLTAANEKLKMVDLSASETRTEFEEQKRKLFELQVHLKDMECQVREGEELRKKLHNTILELKGNIRVFCRIRPLLPEDGLGTDMVISYPTSTEVLGRGVELVQSGQKYPFTFDKVFSHYASQKDIFIEISQLVQSALDGYKVCIFAYGQTGSGKTYTMMGRPDTPELKGLIPRSLDHIFQTSQALMARGWKYRMQASMLEIYNETIRDLLTTNQSSCLDLPRTENGVASKQYTISHEASGKHVSDLSIVDVSSITEISSLLQQAARSRSVGKTQMNEHSSRSHSVFTLRIWGFNERTEQQVQGVLNLIDLAGSERLSRSGATGDRLKETQAINKSLSCLSNVINALAKKEAHVPFRNSKLTYLLQPCLGGDSKTLMFVNISPDASSTAESLCSLRFAAKVNDCHIGIPHRQTMTTRSFDSRLSCG